MKKATCHPDRKYHAKGLCTECYHKNTHNQRMKNPDYIKSNRDRANKWRIDNPERTYTLDANKHLVKRYGITLAEYTIINKQQNALCKICNKPETIITKKRVAKLAVDHCHKTGKIRGLLCFQCNVFISLLDNNRRVLPTVISYLEITNESI